MAVPSVPDRAVDPDLHSFSLLDPDPDPHSICGSGSSRINLSTKNRKSTRKLPVLRIWIRTDPHLKNLPGMYPDPHGQDPGGIKA